MARRAKLTEEMVRQAIGLKADGLSNGDIICALGIHESTFYRWIGEPKNRLQRELSKGLKKEEAEFKHTLRTESQCKAFKLALQVLGDLTGLGVNYFDLDNVGYVKTATEVSSDNSALMRNIRKNENALSGALCGVSRALMACSRTLGVELPGEGDVGVSYDDSIVQDTDAEKRRDMSEVAAGLMQAWEYRTRWYGEDEATARRNAGAGPSRSGPGNRQAPRASPRG